MNYIIGCETKSLRVFTCSFYTIIYMLVFPYITSNNTLYSSSIALVKSVIIL